MAEITSIKFFFFLVKNTKKEINSSLVETPPLSRPVMLTISSFSLESRKSYTIGGLKPGPPLLHKGLLFQVSCNYLYMGTA